MSLAPLSRIAVMAVAVATLALPLTVVHAADTGPRHKVVIQVSSNDPASQQLALNNAVNIQKDYGIDNVAIEIVAYGPGLVLLTDKSEQAERVRSLEMQDVQFSACGNTMKSVAKKTGKEPNLIPGVKIVEAGVRRIIELQEQGWSYIRP